MDETRVEAVRETWPPGEALTPDPGKLLIVDDRARDGAAARAHDREPLSEQAAPGVALSSRLANCGYAVEVVASGPKALDKIRQSKFDLVVLDQLTPGSTESDLVRLLGATYSSDELPLVVATGAPLSEVAARIETQLSRTRALHHAQRVDWLTGLGNRAALLDKLRALLEAHPSETSSAGGRSRAAVLSLDLDGFRRLNTSLGDTFGNGLLIETARRLEEAVRSTGWGTNAAIARIGDDEFAVAGPDLTDRRLDAVASSILSSLNQPVAVQGFRLPLSASIGIASIDVGVDSAEDLLRDAHLAVERAGQLGGRRVVHFDEGLRKRAQSRVTLAIELQAALEQKQFFAVYQPKISLRERRIEGFEALLRWRRANGEIVPPGDFIPIAEDTGVIRDIGLWVLEEACRQLAAWQQQYPSAPSLSMNVNVSVRQLGDFRLVHRVREILEETGIAPESLNLELTESALMSDIESARLVLEHLHALNIGLKLDDFGTGFSSLSYLRALRFDSLKIAPCFITKLATDHESRAIVESIVTLAHALNMNVVAEGIETEAQLRALEELGCDLGQGFLFYKPLSPVAAAELLRRGLHGARPGFAPALAFEHFHGSRLAG